MGKRINHATVIGAGTMGAAIAGHLANAGVSVHLLDIVPTELTPEEEAKGLTLDDPEVRNRIVRAGFERMIKAKPRNLFTDDVAERITLGNIEDDLESAVKQSDWVIEVIIERPKPKQALMERLEAIVPPDAVISTNTSGIPIHIIAQGRSPEFKRRFLGTHFFNPPRYLHLLEIIPTPETDPAIVARMRDFAERRLGKGVVIAKDTPNFIANRMISFIQSDLMKFAIENGYTVEEVDRLTGPLIGRPKTGTFRLNDIVGIDVMAMVSENLYQLIPQDEDREILRDEQVTKVMQTLIQANLLGNKTGQGFYKRVEEGGKKAFWGLDLQAAVEGEIEYLPPEKPRWAIVDEVREMPLEERLRRLVESDDEAGELIWHTFSHTFAYASKRIPEIADRIVDIDNAMKWGFAWELGIFETWDVLGVAETLDRMEGEGLTVAPWVHEMLEAGHESFYRYENGQRMAYSPLSKRYEPAIASERVIVIKDLKKTRGVLAENDSASLLDLGDGVLLLEFHTKMNALDEGIFQMGSLALEKLHGGATGLVISNQGQNFSAGANLFLIGMLAQSGQWDELDRAIRTLQGLLMGFRQAPAPVVVAPFQLTLGGGAEVSMHGDRILAHAETYMGLVEVGVGLIPAGGGCKEMVRRNVSPHMHAENVNPSPYLQQIFETIGFAKVSTSGPEARQLGFLGDCDQVVMNYDHLIYEAKQEVLALDDAGYAPPKVTKNVYAAGADQLANMRVGIYGLREAGYISEYDAHLADKLAWVLCGGDLSAPAWMDEQYFLDLEREAFKSLCGEEKTQERIWHMLQTGKPLRN